VGGQPELTQLALENEALRVRVAELQRVVATNSDAARFLQSLLAAVPAIVVRTDSALRMRYVSSYQPGLAPEQVVGRSILDFIEPDFREHVRKVLEHTRTTGEVGSYQARGVGPHGTSASYQTHVSALSGEDGSAGLCVACLEMTAHEQREERLRETEAKLRLALEATGLGLWSWDALSHEMVWDDAMRRLHGAEPPLDFETYIATLVHPEDRPGFVLRSQNLFERGRLEGLPYRILRPDGQVRWVLASGRVIADHDGAVLKIMGGTLDITEHRGLEEQLRQSQKMEAIGSLTAGVAHNFNNMLSVIMPTLEMVAPFVPPEHQPLARDAAHASQRASELVRQLMTFAGRSNSQGRSVHDVLEIVDAAVGICRRAFDHRLLLYTIYEAPPAAVFCNAGQIEQVLVNLLLNARDAVIDGGVGRGRVTVRVTTRDQLLGPLAGQLESRPGVCIEVMDDGIGMSEEAKAKAFEPFFTTKALGRGTGLGLATSYAIVRDHEGSIACCSQPGGGSTFTVLLPLSDQSAGPVTRLSGQPLPRSLCALLVDDEAAVRNAVGHVLVDAGLRVLSAGNGADALAQLAGEPETDVVLLDRSMPDGPGECLVPRMRELAPRARILFFSGETLEPELVGLADGIVQKPVHGRQLLDAIGRVLARESLRLDS
jgi:PAS domain S-box-containing protein